MRMYSDEVKVTLATASHFQTAVNISPIVTVALLRSASVFVLTPIKADLGLLKNISISVYSLTVVWL